MKTIIISIISLFYFSLVIMGQAKKPKIMVVPSDIWCNDKGYTTTFDNQGEEVIISDYKKALQTDRELSNVISKINILMQEKGFPLVDMASTLKSILNTAAENSVLKTKTSGSKQAESPVDKLRRTAKADIRMEIDWGINETGPKKSVTYNLKGIDSYSGKQIAGAQGTGSPSFSADIPVLLEEAVQNNMDNFISQLQAHFDDLQENGREVVLELSVPENNSGLDFEKEFEGKELTEIIDDWMAENTVNHRFNKSDATENFILFDQVRIPLYKENGMSMDTEAFARQLTKYLANAPFGLKCKVVNRGLGRCLLIVGEK
ncbi:MAG: DUF6175 family protein [Bacteroidaceae bacterium]